MRESTNIESAPPDLLGQLRDLEQIAAAVNSTLDLATVLQTLIDSVCTHSRWSLGGVTALDYEHGVVRRLFRHHPQSGKQSLGESEWPLSNSATREAIEQRRALIVHHVQDSRYPNYRQEASLLGYRTAVILPLGVQDEVGRPLALSVQSSDSAEVGDIDLAFLEAVAHLAAIAVTNSQNHQRERQMASRLRSVFALQCELSDQVLAGAPLAEIARSVETMLDGAVALLDQNSNVLAEGTSPVAEIPQTEWASVVSSEGAALVAKLAKEAAVRPDRTGAADRSSVIDLRLSLAGTEHVLRTVPVALSVSGSSVGTMLVFLRGDPIDELTLLAIEEARLALSLHIMRSHIAFEVESRLRSDLMSRLFSSDWRDPAEVVSRAGYLGINLARASRLIVISDLADSSSVTLRADDGTIFREIHTQLSHLLPRASIVLNDSLIVLVLPTSVIGGGAVLREAINRLQGYWTRRFDDELVAAMSAECENLEEYAHAWNECRNIADAARSLGRSGLVTTADIGPYGLLFSVAENESIEGFIRDTIGKLEDYDTAHQAQLVETLRVMLREAGNHARTAKILQIHVSTLRYRLERIGSVLGIDLHDPDMRFALELALRLRRL